MARKENQAGRCTTENLDGFGREMALFEQVENCEVNSLLRTDLPQCCMFRDLPCFPWF